MAAIGAFDQTINRQVLLAIPSLYKCSQADNIYTYQNFILVMFVGIYQSVICHYVPFLAYYGIILDGGRTVDMQSVGTTMAVCAVFNANLFCLLCSKYWTWIHIIFTWFSTLTIFLYIIGASYVLASPLYGVIGYTLGSSIFWFTLIMATALCQLPWLFYEYIRRTYFGTDVEEFQSINKNGGLRVLTQPQCIRINKDDTNVDNDDLRSPLPQIIASPLPPSVLERNASKYGLTQLLQPQLQSETPALTAHRESVMSNQSSVIMLSGEMIHGGFAFSKEDGVGRAERIITSPEKRKLDRRHTISVVRPMAIHQHKRSKSK